MNTLPRWWMHPTFLRVLKVTSVLFIVFCFGAITGSLVTVRFFRKTISRFANPPEMTTFMMKQLDQQLSLTPEQEKKIEPICRNIAQDIATMTIRGVQQRRVILDRLEAEIAPELTDEQAGIFHETMQKRINQMTDLTSKK